MYRRRTVKTGSFRKLKFVTLVLFLALLLVNVHLTHADENYCKDPESWKEWDALLEKYPGDLEVQALHALRVGLCLKVERGDLTVDQATEIFENAREAILQKRRAEKGKKDGLGL